MLMINLRYATLRPPRGLAETVARAANSISSEFLQKEPKVTVVTVEGAVWRTSLSKIAAKSGAMVRAATILSFMAALTTVSFAQSIAPLQRTPIAVHDIAPPKEVTSTSVVRLDFKPGQPTGRHMHPVPVVGYVLEGEFIVKIENEPEKHYTAGQSIYEPANTVIERYDNASDSKPAVLIASYLVGQGQTELIKFLPSK
jgi:quercetin dioxygenase-like cupin family protein